MTHARRSVRGKVPIRAASKSKTDRTEGRCARTHRRAWSGSERTCAVAASRQAPAVQPLPCFAITSKSSFPDWASMERLIGHSGELGALALLRQAWRTRLPEELYPTRYIAERTCDALTVKAAGGQPFFIQCLKEFSVRCNIRMQGTESLRNISSHKKITRLIC